MVMLGLVDGDSDGVDEEREGGNKIHGGDGIKVVVFWGDECLVFDRRKMKLFGGYRVLVLRRVYDVVKMFGRWRMMVSL